MAAVATAAPRARIRRLNSLAAQTMPVLLSNKRMPLERFEDLPVDVLAHVHHALANAKLCAKNVIPVLELATARGWDDVRSNCLRFIQASFSGLLKLLGTDCLCDAMGHSTFDTMFQEYEQTLAEIEQLHKIGRPLEHSWPEGVVPKEDGTLPYEVLSLPLSTWPAFVDSRQRESYLSDADFQRVFRKTRAQFYSMPRWRQQRAKVEVSLW